MTSLGLNGMSITQVIIRQHLEFLEVNCRVYNGEPQILALGLMALFSTRPNIREGPSSIILAFKLFNYFQNILLETGH